MTKTRNDRSEYAKQAYRYVIEEFLERSLGSTIDQALENSGCDGDIRNVITLTEKDISQLMHKESPGEDKKMITLNLGSRNLLRCLKAFYVCEKNAGVDIESTWCEIPGDEFDRFRLNFWDPEHNYKLNSASSLIGPSTTGTNLPTRTVPKYTQAELFERSLKKDPSLLPTLQDIVHWDNWH